MVIRRPPPQICERLLIGFLPGQQRIGSNQAFIPPREEPATNSSTSTASTISTIECEHCEKKFANKFSLSRHTRNKHIDKYPFRCAKCDRGFLDEKNHKNHTSQCNTRKYQCYLCDKCTTFDITKLRVHINTKHMNKYIRCSFDGCVSKFRSIFSMQRHSIKVHGPSN